MRTAPLFLLLGCPKAPAPSSTADPAQAVVAYEVEVYRICEEGQRQLRQELALTECRAERPDRFTMMLAEAVASWDEGRNPTPLNDRRELPSPTMQCDEVPAQELDERQLQQLEAIARATMDVEMGREAWDLQQDEGSRLGYLTALEALHGACMALPPPS